MGTRARITSELSMLLLGFCGWSDLDLSSHPSTIDIVALVSLVSIVKYTSPNSDMTKSDNPYNIQTPKL